MSAVVLEDYLTQKQAAESKGMDYHTVWRWVRAGKLPTLKVGQTVLIKKSDLAAITPAPQAGKPRGLK